MTRLGTYIVAGLWAASEVLPPVIAPLLRRGIKRSFRPVRLQPPMMSSMQRHLPLKATLPPPGRRRGTLVVVAHDADKAGQHTEIYLHDSKSGIAHNVGVAKLPLGMMRTNGDGWLTQASKQEIQLHWRAKAAGRDWLAVSNDHSPSDARASWSKHSDGPRAGERGAGSLRQVIHEEPVEILSDSATVQFMSWWINPHSPIYFHLVFKDTRVGVIGTRKISEPEFDDRLHLTYDGDDVDRFLRNLHEGRASKKIDGASVHFRASRQGTRYFSPRLSKETGRRIEYSFKLGEMQDITSEETVQGMGELVFVRDGRELPFNEVGGLLNANRLPPEDVHPRIYVYRIDKVGRKSLMDEPYWESNRARCQSLAGRHRWLDVPVEVPLGTIEDTKDWEGVVGVPAGQSLAAGRKLKWQGDDQDAVVTRVDFRWSGNVDPSGRQRVAGVVEYQGIDGRMYKTSSGWSEAEKQDMMEHPEMYEGRVMRLSGFEGSNRAVKFSGWHLCKGTG